MDLNLNSITSTFRPGDGYYQLHSACQTNTLYFLPLGVGNHPFAKNTFEIKKMKNVFLFSFFIIGLFSILSCSKKDKCEDVVCQNAGICEDGNCKCPTGYEGDRCQNESLPKAIKISSIKVLKFPATKTDGSKWDADGTNPDLLPVFYTMKSDGKAVDQVLWTSSTVLLNAKTDGQPEFSIILPELKFTTIDKLYALFLFDKDDSSQEVMGSGITFNLKEFIKGRPATIKLECQNCVFGFELKVNYEF